jgi:16S rRNA pseudouridine516 synthase
MRIDKYISELGIASRKEAASVARSGGVLRNSIPVRDLSIHIDPERDVITYAGRVLNYKKYVYVMLNKPAGYVSATEDSKLPVVTELLSEELRRRELFPVGRLDRDTVGLMILTNNGKLAHTVLSPKHHVEKKYFFRSAEPLPEGAEDRFKNRITLADGYECKEALIELDEGRKSGIITLTEGKYHQIKRMIASFGNAVVYLKRITFANIPLDGALAEGEWRFLTDDEERLLLASAGGE